MCGSFWDCDGDQDDLDEEEVRARPLCLSRHYSYPMNVEYGWLRVAVD
jgi:hypothetical protein